MGNYIAARTVHLDHKSLHQQVNNVLPLLGQRVRQCIHARPQEDAQDVRRQVKLGLRRVRHWRRLLPRLPMLHVWVGCTPRVRRYQARRDCGLDHGRI